MSYTGPKRRQTVLPFNITELLASKLAANRRPPDGKLHPSGALTGSLRHVQLEAAGAPTLEPDLVSEVNLAVGTAIHNYFEGVLRGKPLMMEVKLDAWLPEGWSGTADWVVWNHELRGFVLGDLKSCKPGAIHFLKRDGSKESQRWQVSAYWHALRKMGIPLVNGFVIYHLPKSQLLRREGEPVSPLLIEDTPIPWEEIEERMVSRRAAVDEYLKSISFVGQEVPPHYARSMSDSYLTDKLAPVQPREVKMFLNKALKTPCIDVKLVPNWSTDYCPYSDELCGCRNQKANKVGHWELHGGGMTIYVPRKDVDQPDVIEQPNQALINALNKEINAASSKA